MPRFCFVMLNYLTFTTQHQTKPLLEKEKESHRWQVSQMPGQVIACVAACLRVPVDDVESSGQSACQPTLGQKPCHDEEGRYQHAVQRKHWLDVEKYCTVLNATRKHQLTQLPSKNIYYLQLYIATRTVKYLHCSWDDVSWHELYKSSAC